MEGLSLDEFVAITARIQSGVPRQQALDEAEISDEQWLQSQQQWLSRMASQSSAGNLILHRQFVDELAKQQESERDRQRADKRQLDGAQPQPPRKRMLAVAGRAGSREAARPRSSPPLPSPIAAPAVVPRAQGPWPAAAKPSAQAPPSAAQPPASGSPQAAPERSQPSPTPAGRKSSTVSTKTVMTSAIAIKPALPFQASAKGSARAKGQDGSMRMTMLGSIGGLPPEAALPFSPSAKMPSDGSAASQPAQSATETQEEPSPPELSSALPFAPAAPKPAKGEAASKPIALDPLNTTLDGAPPASKGPALPFAATVADGAASEGSSSDDAASVGPFADDELPPDPLNTTLDGAPPASKGPALPFAATIVDDAATEGPPAAKAPRGERADSTPPPAATAAVSPETSEPTEAPSSGPSPPSDPLAKTMYGSLRLPNEAAALLATMALEPDGTAPGTEPSTAPSSEAQAGSSAMTLEQYAWLCAALEAAPDRRDQTLAWVRLSVADKERADTYWQQQFERDPEKRAAFELARQAYLANARR